MARPTRFALPAQTRSRARARCAPHRTRGFKAQLSRDPRRYNHPAVTEVAAVFIGEDGAPPCNRDLRVWPLAAERVENVAEQNECVDPLTYVLLFPGGLPGWHENLQHRKERRTKTYQRLTATQFYAHRLMIFDDDNPLPHAAGMLFQQYVVDVYCRAEAQRLAYLRMHQDELRAESYQELRSAIDGAGFEAGATPVGRRVVLPSSYVGSPRAMHQNYLDAMTLVRHHGKPDLFITFTANPRWPEISDNLRPYETAVDRPDLMARVFHLKTKALLRDVVTLGVLGRVAAFTWVIEFQKRGLPHMHLLVILDPAWKIRSAQDVDRCVSAELPDASGGRQAELAATVLRCQVHGPCGARKPLAPCMEHGACAKGYPRSFQDCTELREGAYPAYRRRDDGRSALKGEQPMDNRDVVPYNPLLSRKYDAHINVEVVSSVKAVKYLYKYSYKGHDRAELEATAHDEIAEHLDCRYVGPPEACWRLFQFPMYDKSHTIFRLALHLPDQQTLYFEPGQEEAALAAPAAQQTTLTAWLRA